MTGKTEDDLQLPFSFIMNYRIIFGGTPLYERTCASMVRSQL